VGKFFFFGNSSCVCVCVRLEWITCLETVVARKPSRSAILVWTWHLFFHQTCLFFQPIKRVPEGTHAHDLLKYASATLGSGADLRVAVQLPDGEDLNEWVAVHIVDFFNQISMLYGTITEFCTPQRCPIMSAGPKYEYHWADGQTVKKPIKCSAPQVN
jgi:MOB kinase activator 1